jgi:hypothetical protein
VNTPRRSSPVRSAFAIVFGFGLVIASVRGLAVDRFRMPAGSRHSRGVPMKIIHGPQRDVAAAGVIAFGSGLTLIAVLSLFRPGRQGPPELIAAAFFALGLVLIVVSPLFGFR